jgi:hypothetical protein
MLSTTVQPTIIYAKTATSTTSDVSLLSFSSKETSFIFMNSQTFSSNIYSSDLGTVTRTTSESLLFASSATSTQNSASSNIGPNTPPLPQSYILQSTIHPTEIDIATSSANNISPELSRPKPGPSLTSSVMPTSIFQSSLSSTNTSYATLTMNGVSSESLTLSATSTQNSASSNVGDMTYSPLLWQSIILQPTIYPTEVYIATSSGSSISPSLSEPSMQSSFSSTFDNAPTISSPMQSISVQSTIYETKDDIAPSTINEITPEILTTQTLSSLSQSIILKSSISVTMNSVTSTSYGSLSSFSFFNTQVPSIVLPLSSSDPLLASTPTFTIKSDAYVTTISQAATFGAENLSSTSPLTTRSSSFSKSNIIPYFIKVLNFCNYRHFLD